MKIVIIQVGRTAQHFVREGISLYESRLQHYLPVEVITLQQPGRIKTKDSGRTKEREGTWICSMVQPGDFLVLLDERGKQYSSRQFAAFLEKHMVGGLKKLIFVIGGAYGFSDRVYNRANQVISLSKMTFSHQLVRVVFLEQLYRALTIIRGDPYHHD